MTMSVALSENFSEWSMIEDINECGIEWRFKRVWCEWGLQ